MNNEANEGLKDLLCSLAAVCEVAGFMRDKLIDNGFTREESCGIVTEVVLEFISIGEQGRRDVN